MLPMRHLAALSLALLSPLAIGVPQTLTVVDATGRPVPQAAVSVLVKGARLTSGATADMAQRSRNFDPYVLVVQTGTAVSFPNFDTVRHHVYSFSPIKSFEIKLYAGTPAAPVVFDRPGTATLGCNIHDRMVAYIHVVDTPHFGTTNAAGQLTLDLPAGDHVVRVWAPLMGEQATPHQAPLRTGVPLTIRLPA